MRVRGVPFSRGPRALTVALLVVFLEAAALAVGCVLLVVDIVRGPTLPVGSSVTVVLFLGGIAAFLVGAGRALAAGRRWARGPVLTWQLIQGAIGVTQIRTAPLVGGLLIATAVVALAGLVAPSSIAATSLTGAERPDDAG